MTVLALGDEPPKRVRRCWHWSWRHFGWDGGDVVAVTPQFREAGLEPPVLRLLECVVGHIEDDRQRTAAIEHVDDEDEDGETCIVR